MGPPGPPEDHKVLDNCQFLSSKLRNLTDPGRTEAEAVSGE